MICEKHLNLLKLLDVCTKKLVIFLRIIKMTRLDSVTSNIHDKSEINLYSYIQTYFRGRCCLTIKY